MSTVTILFCSIKHAVLTTSPFSSHMQSYLKFLLRNIKTPHTYKTHSHCWWSELHACKPMLTTHPTLTISPRVDLMIVCTSSGILKEAGRRRNRCGRSTPQTPKPLWLRVSHGWGHAACVRCDIKSHAEVRLLQDFPHQKAKVINEWHVSNPEPYNQKQYIMSLCSLAHFKSRHFITTQQCYHSQFSKYHYNRFKCTSAHVAALSILSHSWHLWESNEKTGLHTNKDKKK